MSEEIQTQEFIDIINEGHIPTSSQPSIGEVKIGGFFTFLTKSSFSFFISLSISI